MILNIQTCLSRRPLIAIIIMLMAPALSLEAVAANTTLVAKGSVWKYLDNGSDQGTAWTAPAFADGSWASGPALLGYGGYAISTTVSFGGNASNKYTTTYFRKTFNVANPGQFSTTVLRILRDDGAVVFLNGAEVFRTNMPAGAYTYTTFAPGTVATDNSYYSVLLSPALLNAGDNTLAVEVHQVNLTSSDLAFDLEFVGTTDTVFIPMGATWKYLDNGSDQGTAWRNTVFADGGWASGAAQLGYGDGDEATVVSFGGNSSNKYVTTYFRHAFNVANPTDYVSLTLDVLRDDGSVVYLNGTEIQRGNMPGGTITYTTFATSAIDDTIDTVSLGAGGLVAGTNVIAVEMHQVNLTSSDLSFDLQLTGSTTHNVIRGPYIQMSTPNSTTIVWRTNGLSDSVVRYGPSPSNLNQTVSNGTPVTQHEINLTSLLPDTRYYYSVGTTSATLAGGDADHYFDTHPVVASTPPVRVWVLGDSGTADANAASVRNAMSNEIINSGTDIDLWLMLGDNAYNDGTDAEFQAAVFDMYPSYLRTKCLWPTLGNHDGISANSSTQTGPYYDIFVLPKNGEAGGLPSGTEAYFSFDYANIHFICLDSNETPRGVNDPMLTWAAADASASDQDWIIAFWHQAPYSKGSRNSETEVDMTEMRQNAMPILEAAGVDLVLGGHSHSYERSFLVNGAYDTPTTAPGHIIDAGDGRETGTGAYTKPKGTVANKGTVAIVAGSSGKIGGGSLNHVLMYKSLNVLGSLILDVEGDRLDGTFLDSTGVKQDWFTMIKTTDAGTTYREWNEYR